MINPVACAYAEKTPIVIVSGGPAMNVRKQNVFMHHMVKDFDSQLKVYSQVTQAAVILNDAATASEKIYEALTACQDYALPVYIELPTDVVDEAIVTMQSKSGSETAEKTALKEASHRVLQRMQEAEKPVLMVGVEADRFGLKEEILALSRKFNVPVVASLLARDLIPQDDPNYFGTYLGNAGNAVAKKLVDDADCLLLMGVILSDMNLGSMLAKTKAANIIECVSRQVKLVDHTYDNVPLRDLLISLSEAEPLAKEIVFPRKPVLQINRACKYTPSAIVTGEIVDALNWFFNKYGEMPIISDTGDCLFITLKVKTSMVMSSAYYATMGFAVPAAIGYSVTTGKRPMVLVGDGGFQMTGQEVCHCPRYGINPIFLVINNRRWGMEQLFFESARFNELVNWPYSKLAELWGGKGYLCDSCDKLYRALEDAGRQETFSLIEVVTSKEELSEEVLAWVDELKKQT
jgi:indolepyruvate decarboxylase